jgi:hypothetical protein
MTKERNIWLAKRNIGRRKDKNPPPGVTYIPESSGKVFLGIRWQCGPTPDLEQLMTEILDVPFVWRVFKLAMEQHLAKKRP